ncbi:hypothetical protein GCM10027190_24950 [Spirosoma areae]
MLFALVSLLLLTSCNRETLFQSNFDPTSVNQPPATNQQVGTANVDGPVGSVKVIASPVQTGGKWVQITRTANQQSVSGLKCNLSTFKGDGEYTFSTFMFMPSGSGIATIQFEPIGQAPSTLTSFLHLDFMPDNKVRLDDDAATTFGSFPRDKIFSVVVTLRINASPTAHIALGGDGASGEKEHTILSPFRSIARQFGAARLWMGFPHTGSFDATTIVVNRKQ